MHKMPCHITDEVLPSNKRAEISDKELQDRMDIIFEERYETMDWFDYTEWAEDVIQRYWQAHKEQPAVFMQVIKQHIREKMNDSLEWEAFVSITEEENNE